MNLHMDVLRGNNWDDVMGIGPSPRHCTLLNFHDSEPKLYVDSKPMRTCQLLFPRFHVELETDCQNRTALFSKDWSNWFP